MSHRNALNQQTSSLPLLIFINSQQISSCLSSYKDGGVPDYPVHQLDLGVKPLERHGGLPRPNYTVEEGKFSEDLELFRKLQEDLGRKIDMVNNSGDADQNTKSLSWPQKVLEYFVDSMVHLVVSVPFVILLLCVTKWYWKK